MSTTTTTTITKSSVMAKINELYAKWGVMSMEERDSIKFFVGSSFEPKYISGRGLEINLKRAESMLKWEIRPASPKQLALIKKMTEKFRFGDEPTLYDIIKDKNINTRQAGEIIDYCIWHKEYFDMFKFTMYLPDQDAMRMADVTVKIQDHYKAI